VPEEELAEAEELEDPPLNWFTSGLSVKNSVGDASVFALDDVIRA
jgi:hypothetical protein